MLIITSGKSLAKGRLFQLNSIRDKFPRGLTFFKDFTTAADLIANYARGVNTPTFTASRGATTPATYIDSNGIIQLVTTSNVPRYAGGYYDATGFHVIDSNGKSARGLMIETAGTNMLKDSYFAGTITDNWRASAAGGTISSTSERTSPYGIATQVAKVNTDGDAKGIRTNYANKPTLTSGTVYTISVFVRGSGSIKLVSTVDASEAQQSSTITLQDSYWQYQSYTFIANATGTANMELYQTGAGATTFYVAGIQIETSFYATSFILTTTAALTRNAEVLKYPILNNRAAAQETIVIKYVPFWAGASPTTANRLLASDTKDRAIALLASADSLTAYPNITDDATDLATQTLDPAINTSYTLAAVFKHTSPYAEIYSNGISQGTWTTNDFTDPAWGESFYIGSNNANVNQLNGLIQKVAIFNRALTASEVLAVSNAM